MSEDLIEFFTAEAHDSSFARFSEFEDSRGYHVGEWKSPERCRVTMTNAKRWPDFIRPKMAHHPVLTSQSVIEDLKEAELTGWECHDVAFYDNKLKPFEVPEKYWVLRPKEKISVLAQVYEVVETGGARKRELRFKNAEIVPSFIKLGYFPDVQFTPVLESWDGADIFQYRDESLFGGFGCSRRFVELARDKGWSNLCVNPFTAFSTRYEDFRKMPWPPEEW